MNEISEFENNIKKALKENKSTFDINEIISLTRECKEDVIKDELEHGGTPDIEFWNFISDGINNIFTVFEKDLLIIYIIREHLEKVTEITNQIPMSDVAELKTILKNTFNVSTYTASLQRSIAEYWLSV